MQKCSAGRGQLWPHRCFQWCRSSVVIEFSFVSQVCQLWALNVKLQYCNVNTNYIWAVFLFIGKDIQVFLVFRRSAFCSWTCWTGVINTVVISAFCPTLNCQRMLSPDPAGTRPSTERSNHWRCEMYRCVPRSRQESLLNNNRGSWGLKGTTSPEIKAQRRAFCMLIWKQSLFVVMWLIPTLPIFF